MYRYLLRLVIAVCLIPFITLAENPSTRSLGRVFEKLKGGQETTIAYFGGSITAAAGYRVKTFKWFQDTFPNAKLREINAAIGGTGSDLGAFRCGMDVIAQKPDLVFVEFNINDGSPTNEFRKATMEGIVRQLWSSETRPEIVFLYTTSRDLKCARGSHPAVAKHYGIPEIDLQPPLIEALKRPDLPKPTEEQLKNPKLNWKSIGQVFMGDSVHPNNLGHTIYTDTIVTYLKTQIDAKPLPAPVLSAPLVNDEFQYTKLVPPGKARLSGDWEVLPADEKSGLLKRYKEGTINARKPGDSLEFEFTGTALGLFENVQKDGGKYEWTIDDGEDGEKDKNFGGPKGVKHGIVDTAPGPYFARNHYAMLCCGLPQGKHTLKIKVLEEHDKTSTGNRLLIGYFMVGGAR
ncbi:MAG: SGNH/GDSL hydrolase family protein [Kiritimatiellae bacterium]|nr:SGNH/GDSL hydrolase family protein [Kiritimatiellia bacterium]MDD5522017.1 SGNH/GDSL hydrolase family protein [Kiritimatiellia bacterium]